MEGIKEIVGQLQTVLPFQEMQEKGNENWKNLVY